MSTDTVTLFLALLAIASQLFVAAAAGLALAARVSSAAHRLRADVVAHVSPSVLTLAFVVAAVSMAGSLYFSEVANFVPCKLCWYQRIAMYPLVPILALAAWRRDLGIRPYVVTVAVIGAGISSYHILVERFPSTFESAVCDAAAPCSLIWVERFGYLTIPGMALSAFALIAVLLLIPHKEAA